MGKFWRKTHFDIKYLADNRGIPSRMVIYQVYTFKWLWWELRVMKSAVFYRITRIQNMLQINRSL